MTTQKADKKCVVCKLDLNLQKSFREREDWETVNSVVVSVENRQVPSEGDSSL